LTVSVDIETIMTQ